MSIHVCPPLSQVPSHFCKCRRLATDTLMKAQRKPAALLNGCLCAHMPRWEKEVVQLREGRGHMAEGWSRAYWVLHKELEALRQVMGAFYDSSK